eukprot:1159436-Pelagomonas_calceolata.AAC.1
MVGRVCLNARISSTPSALATLPSPNASPRMWQSCRHGNQLIRKPYYLRGCAPHAGGGGEQAQSLGSSMTPPKRAKGCGLDNFLVHPVQAKQAHRMLTIHVIISPPSCSIFDQPKPALSFPCSFTHPNK